MKLALISNADAMEVAAWPESPLAGLFDVEVFSCTAGYVKPEPKIYYQCLDQLALKPQECLFVGDGGSNELAGAKAVGLSTVFIYGVVAQLWPERVAERRAISDYQIERIPAVINLLNRDPID